MAAGRQGKKRKRKRKRSAAQTASAGAGLAVAGSLVERLYRRVGDRHHTVPRTHLCRFIVPGTKETLRELTVATGAINDRAASKATVVPLLYHLDPRPRWCGGSLEALWQIEEGLMGPVVDRLISETALSPPSFEVLSRYTLMLHTRNPVWIDAWRRANASVRDGLGARPQRLGAAWLLADWMAPVLAKWYEWTVFRAPAETGFIIGDVPVGAYRRGRGGLGSVLVNLFTADVIFEDEHDVYMPLAPDACLVIRPSNDPDLAMAGRLTAETASADFVRQVNQATVRRSTSAYSPRDDLLEEARV